MRILIKYFLLLGAAVLMLMACKKESPQISDLDKLRNNSNKTSYPVVKMDSAQAIQLITKQKVQELLDLSTLYVSGNRDTEIDSVIYSQILGYFYKPDSLTLRPLFLDLESLKVKSAKVNALEVYRKNFKQDTLDFAKFNVEYFDGSNRSLGTFDKDVHYILHPSPVKFKKEFKFYFLKYYNKPLNDSIFSGQTK